MDNSIYEIDRREYVGFLRELNKEKMDMEEFKGPEYTSIKLKSKKTGKHITTRIIDEEHGEHYYLFNMPDDDEMVKPKGYVRVNLETKEEVQAFFDALKKLQEEHKND